MCACMHASVVCMTFVRACMCVCVTCVCVKVSRVTDHNKQKTAAV